MVGSLIRNGFGIAGSTIALLMFSVPILTFRRVIKKKTTENFSGVPYLIAFFNCLLYSYYGSPFISHEWDNLVVLVVNMIGLVMECFFLAIYITFAPPKTRVKMVRMLVALLTIMGSIVAICFFFLHKREQKRFLVGTVGTVATVVLYGSPLSVIKLVIKTKSVEFMPFNLSLFAFLGSGLWLIYGALSKDILIMAPNFIGVPLAVFQMVLYCIYRYGKSGRIEDGKLDATEMDLENNNLEKTKDSDQDHLELQLKA